MARIEPITSTPQVGRRFDPAPGRVRYSQRWLGATVAGGVLAVVGMAIGGVPAMAAIGVAGALGAAYTFFYEPRKPVLERITLEFPDLPPAFDGLRIGQISDMHLGMRFTAANSRWAVAQMAREQPDLLVFTGDFVSYEHAIDDLPAILAGLPEAPLGRFAVPGNHDYWEGVPEIRQALSHVGIEMLFNEQRLLQRGDDELLLLGVDDCWSGTCDLDSALLGAPEDRFRLLLAHCPDVGLVAAERGVQLQLSGHTHGGHLCLPMLGSFCLPRHGWEYYIGLERAGATQIYVSRGIGGIPIRLGCPPEVTILTLRRAAKGMQA